MRRLLWLWLWLALTPCLAHSLELSNTRLLLPADRTDTELWLRNPEADTWQGEARLYRWQQQDDGEQLLPAEDVALSPRRLQIAAGQRQRLRVVRLGPAPAGVQHAYRLVISPASDVPTPSPPIRYSLPVFLDPVALAAPTLLHLQARALPGQPPQLWLYNEGTRHAHLADLVFVDAKGRRQLLIAGLAGYVLPGRRRHWALPWRADGYAGGRFRARLDHAPEADLDAPPPSFAAGAPGGL